MFYSTANLEWLVCELELIIFRIVLFFQVMVRNCCLSLCQFEIPLEILFDYGRVARLLVAVLQHHNSDHLTQRIVVFLLNSMACHVEGEQKVQVGNIGAIEVSVSTTFLVLA